MMENHFPEDKMRTTILVTGTSDRSSFTGFVAKMLGAEELEASVVAERRPVIISYNRL